MRRLAVAGVALWAFAPHAHAAPPVVPAQLAFAPSTSTVRLFADTDDDDDDGVEDRASPSARAARDVYWVEHQGELPIRSIGGAAVRVIADKRVLTASALPQGRRAKRIGLQGLEPGGSAVDLRQSRESGDVPRLAVAHFAAGSGQGG